MELTLDERNELRRLMNKHLNMEAVVELAEELGVDPENLAGSTKSSKVRELIGHAERHLMMELLIATLVQLHGEVTWPRQTAVSPVRSVDKPGVNKPAADGCDITAVSAHLATITSLAFLQKSDLADALLATPTMNQPQGRQTAVNQLSRDIRYSINAGANPRLDTIGIIDACLNYPGGLAELVTIVHAFERGSQSMTALCQFILTLPKGS
ncbi:MAG: hypothetical protein KC423_14240 [Anaerolineales bacterium]|nr:hypothetical protein [Anaerolineales bacterium]